MEIRIFSGAVPEDAAGLRREIFVSEQGFTDEFDEFDQKSVHLVLYRDGIAAATLRFYDEGGKSCHVGRVAVKRELRKEGLGRLLMNEAFLLARGMGFEKMSVGAQEDKAGFYEKCGFISTGKRYLEQDYPHVALIKDLTADVQENGMAKMRRSDREITDFDEIVKIMEQCDVCRLALNDVGYPYILPLNFGLKVSDGETVLYFHGAMEGRKYQLIQNDNRASFEMDCAHRLVTDPEKHTCTMEYKSVIGRGIIEEVKESERYDALKILMSHYHREDFEFNPETVPKTRVLKLTVQEISGKKRIVKQ